LKLAIKAALVTAISIILGVGSALWVLNHPPYGFFVSNGPWVTSLKLGSAEGGMYLRAIVARQGLLALNKTEAIYYLAENDSEGDRLSSECDYRIEGDDLPARWWSLTLYGEDNFLIPNQPGIYSYNMKNLKREDGGAYRVFVSRSAKNRNWLPSGEKDQKLSLGLRCYNPEPVLYERPATVRLPRIIKEGCR